ncbi:hypothetical protein NDI49_28445, partial [Trichocoleus sp. ST-U3]
NFWVGLYGQMWIAALELCSDWVRNLMMIRPNKRRFFQNGFLILPFFEDKKSQFGRARCTSPSHP